MEKVLFGANLGWVSRFRTLLLDAIYQVGQILCKIKYMETNHEDTEFITKIKRSESNKGIRNVIIFMLVIAIMWGLAGWIINDGSTLMAIVNIAFLLISLSFASTLVFFLRNRFSGFVSTVISVLVWLLIFGVVRGFF